MLAGKYKLQRQLGRGAAGVVWAAINVATSRQVALKLLLDPEPRAKERLLREARAAGALKHPNVVDVYDVIPTDDGSPALVLELLEGQTLQQLIFERAPLPQHEAAGIARDVARALSVAHASGIVHRDLKPANIFLHRPGEEAPIVKVVDFGISKNLLSVEGSLTQTGMAVGSPSFMSPEQVRGERKIDGRTDLWALGAILYEMLSGKRLFDGRPHEVLEDVLAKAIKPIDERVVGLDPALTRVVNGLLERELEKRIASADEVAEWLATIATVARSRSDHPTERPVPSMGGPHDTAELPVHASSPPAKASTAPGAPAEPSRPPPKQSGASSPPAKPSSAPSAPAPAKGSVALAAKSAVAAPGAKAPVPAGRPAGVGPAGKTAAPAGKVAVGAPAKKAVVAARPAKAANVVVEAPVPKIHEDDDDDEATQVAPRTLRRALAPRPVPNVYEEEDSTDETRVASSLEMNAGIDASRKEGGESDQNEVPTVRPPAAPPEEGAGQATAADAAAGDGAGEGGKEPAGKQAADAAAKEPGPEEASPEKAASKDSAPPEKAAAGEAAAPKKAVSEKPAAPKKAVSEKPAAPKKAAPERDSAPRAVEKRAEADSPGRSWLIAFVVFTLAIVFLVLLQRTK